MLDFLAKEQQPAADLPLLFWDWILAGHSRLLCQKTVCSRFRLTEQRKLCFIATQLKQMTTSNQTIQRREYKRWPGAKEAAMKLGCCYPHLRKCLAGKFHNPELVAKYYALLSSDPASPIPKQK